MTLLCSADNTFHEANNSTEPYRFEPERIDKGHMFPLSNKQSVKWSEQEICFPPLQVLLVFAMALLFLFTGLQLKEIPLLLSLSDLFEQFMSLN